MLDSARYEALRSPPPLGFTPRRNFQLFASSADPAIFGTLATAISAALSGGVALSVLVLEATGGKEPQRREFLTRAKFKLSRVLRHTDSLGALDETALLAVLTGCGVDEVPIVRDRVGGSLRRWGGGKFGFVVGLGAATLSEEDAGLGDFVERAKAAVRPVV